MNNLSKVIFQDHKLQEFYEKALLSTGHLAADVQPVCALLDAYQFFRKIEGAESPRLDAILRELAGAGMRSSLRNWYSDFNGEMNPEAKAFHNLLEKKIGEKLPFRE